MKKITSLICLLLIICILGACATTKTSEKSKLNVVVTNSILADITQNIGKDKINLHSIVPISQDSHEYEPLPEDVKKTTNSDIIFYNGINLETGENAWLKLENGIIINAKKQTLRKLFTYFVYVR